MSVLTHDEYRRLASKEFHGLGPADFPDPRDALIGCIVERIRDRQSFESTGANLTEGHRRVFAAFASRSASLAVRDHSKAMARCSVVSLALSLGTSGAVGDAAMQIPLPFRAAEIIGYDRERVLRDVDPVLSPEVHAVISSFVAAQDLAYAVGGMGYEEVGDGPTFRFAFTAW
jgi:hypothetical protein